MENNNNEELAKECERLHAEVRELRIELKISRLESTVLRLQIENYSLVNSRNKLAEQLEALKPKEVKE